MKVGGAEFWDANIADWAEAARANDAEAKRMLRKCLADALRESRLGPHGRAALLGILERDEGTPRPTGAPSTRTRDGRVYLDMLVYRNVWGLVVAAHRREGKDAADFLRKHPRPYTVGEAAARVAPGYGVSTATAKRIFYAEQKRQHESAKKG